MVSCQALFLFLTVRRARALRCKQKLAKGAGFCFFVDDNRDRRSSVLELSKMNSSIANRRVIFTYCQ